MRAPSPLLYRRHKVCTIRVRSNMCYSRRQFTKNAVFLAGGSFWASSLAAQGAHIIHTVSSGDTLGHIAESYGVRASQIRSANSIKGDLIRLGQKLVIPGATPAPLATSTNAETYTVTAGDTLGAIAIRYGISVRDLKRQNNLRTDVIRIGQNLEIPDKAAQSGDLLTPVQKETAKINVQRSNWKRIVVHHSGIKYGNAKKYDAAHRRRGMQNGLAYHFLIGNGIDSGDGEIEIGPRWKRQLLGGHVKNYKINLTAIGICLVGNFEKTHPSRKQIAAFTQLMDWLRGEVVPSATQFAGHRELRGEQTICPGKNFPLKAMHQRYDV